jgi:hypothetical protein
LPLPREKDSIKSSNVETIESRLLCGELCCQFVGNFEVGVDFLGVVVVVESFHQAQGFAGGVVVELQQVADFCLKIEDFIESFPLGGVV